MKNVDREKYYWRTVGRRALRGSSIAALMSLTIEQIDALAMCMATGVVTELRAVTDAVAPEPMRASRRESESEGEAA